MHDLIEQAMTYVRGMWRFRWYAMALAWGIALTGWIAVSQMPDVYKVVARVHVDTASVLRPLLRGLAVQTDVTQRVRLINRTLINRPNMEKVARMTDLDLEAKTPQEMDTLLNGLANDIRLSNTDRINLYSISYQHSDPEIAKNVVQSLLTLFVEGALDESRESSDVAEKFLDQQIQEYEQRLIAAEERLKEFKKENVGVLSEGGSYYGRLQAAQNQLSEASLKLREAINRRDELKRLLAKERPAIPTEDGDNASFSMLGNSDQRIQELKSRLDTLLLQYTDEHPEIVNLKRTIATLQEQQIPGEENGANLAGGSQNNPVYQQLKISLGNAEAEVASLSVRVKEYQTRVSELEDLVDTVPEIEAQLKRLDRDYGLNKSNYDELLARRESIKMSENVEQSGDNIKFKVIEPPRVPLKPTGPNRKLLSGAVLLIALGAGAGLAFLLSQIRPAFYDQRSLQRIIGYPVFGSVSRVWTRNVLAKRRFEFGAFLSVCSLLVFAYGAVFLMHGDIFKLVSKLIG